MSLLIAIVNICAAFAVGALYGEAIGRSDVPSRGVRWRTFWFVLLAMVLLTTERYREKRSCKAQPPEIANVDRRERLGAVYEAPNV